MKYLFNHNGTDLWLVVDKVENGVAHMSIDDVKVISSDEVYYDLTNEISMSGYGPGRCYEIITDNYYRSFKNHYARIDIESLTDEQRQDLVSYLEELRQDDSENPDSPFYNDGGAWTFDQTDF